MKDRIAHVVEISGLTKTAFAKRINVSQGLVSQMCNGTTKPSDRTIADICREFGVSRTWLEDGIGEPFRPVDRNEQIAAILSSAITHNDSARDRLIRAFCQLPEEMFVQAEQILLEVVANLQKEKE